MNKVQFFLFGLILIWFTASGKLRALWQALQTEPSNPTTPPAMPAAPATPPVVIGPMPGELIPAPDPILPVMPV